MSPFRLRFLEDGAGGVEDVTDAAELIGEVPCRAGGRCPAGGDFIDRGTEQISGDDAPGCVQIGPRVLPVVDRVGCLRGQRTGSVGIDGFHDAAV